MQGNTCGWKSVSRDHKLQNCLLDKQSFPITRVQKCFLSFVMTNRVFPNTRVQKCFLSFVSSARGSQHHGPLEIWIWCCLNPHPSTKQMFSTKLNKVAKQKWNWLMSWVSNIFNIFNIFVYVYWSSTIGRSRYLLLPRSPNCPPSAPRDNIRLWL